MSHLNVGGILGKLYVLRLQSYYITDKQYLFFMLKHLRNIQYKQTSITTSKEIKTNNSMNLQMLWLERFLGNLVSQSQCNCHNPQESQNENLEIKMKIHKNYKMKIHNKTYTFATQNGNSHDHW